VAAILRLDKPLEIAAVRLSIKQPRGNRLTFRYTDQTGQTLQKGFQAREGAWAEAFISMSGWTGHWGGANDGMPHGPPRQVAFLVENTAGPHGELWLDDVRLIEGKATRGAGMMTVEHVAARFAPPRRAGRKVFGVWCSVLGDREGGKRGGSVSGYRLSGEEELRFPIADCRLPIERKGRECW
jgi:hypothetical protein